MGTGIRFARMVRLLLVVCTVAFPMQSTARDINVVAVHYAPLMIPDGSHRGWAIEVAREALRRAGLSHSVEFLPFNRSVKMVQRTMDTIHPALYRNPKRENKFTWIAKVHVVGNTFNTTNVPVNSLAQARRLEKIGVEAGTAMEDYLTAQGFTNLELAERAEVNASKLAAGRIDAWFLTDVLAAWAWKRTVPDRELVSGAPMSSSDVYIVGGRDFPADLAERIRVSVESMHTDGSITQLLKRYR